MNRKFNWKKFILNLDQYLSAILFIIIMVLLSMQVISRYVFHHSFTWTEELSIILFVWMTYLGVSSAITYRKHLRIDALLTVLPFKAKKFLLIFGNIIFALFNIYLGIIFMKLLETVGNSYTPIIHFPKLISYGVIPFTLVITDMKLVLDCFKLYHENEKELGASKPTIDLEACEREYQEKLKAKED